MSHLKGGKEVPDSEEGESEDDGEGAEEQEQGEGEGEGELKNFEGKREECKLVLVVRTDLGMGKGIFYTSLKNPRAGSNPAILPEMLMRTCVFV